QELSMIGESFLKDVDKGMKNFAIGSVGYRMAQQKTILGIASHLDQNNRGKIVIISDNLERGIFKELYQASSEIALKISGCKESFLVKKFYHHFDFITIQSLHAFIKGLDENLENHTSSVHSLGIVLNTLNVVYDVIFWDIPDLYNIKELP